jgi:hypothetical protein
MTEGAARGSLQIGGRRLAGVKSLATGVLAEAVGT